MVDLLGRTKSAKAMRAGTGQAADSIAPAFGLRQPAGDGRWGNTMHKGFMFGLAGVLLALAACTSAPEKADDAASDPLLAMLGGPQKGPALDKKIAEAEKNPLGSDKNPVRVGGPPGQRDYLDHLRCSNGKAPTYARAGNMGPGIYGSIVDLYIVECQGAE